MVLVNISEGKFPRTPTHVTLKHVLLPECLGPLQLQLQGHLIHFELLFLFGGDEFGIMLLFLSLHLSLRKRTRANISSDEPLST